MTQEEIKALIAEAIAAQMPEMTQAIISAIASVPTPAPAPAKGGKGGKHYHKSSDYTPTEGEVNICTYSDVTTAVWGDLKGKTDILAAIKAFGEGTVKNEKGEDKTRIAQFMRSLASIEGTPCGWLLYTEVLNAKGGVDALADTLQGFDLKVNLLNSVAEITAANKEERKAARKAQETPATPATPAPKASTPAPKVVSINEVKNCTCLEIDREGKTEDGYIECNHTLTKHGEFFTRKDATHTRIYLHIGEGVDDKDGIQLYAECARVKGDYKGNKDDLFNDVAKDVVKAISDDKIKPNKAIGYALWMCGVTQDILNAVFDKIA